MRTCSTYEFPESTTVTMAELAIFQHRGAREKHVLESVFDALPLWVGPRLNPRSTKFLLCTDKKVLQRCVQAVRCLLDRNQRGASLSSFQCYKPALAELLCKRRSLLRRTLREALWTDDWMVRIPEANETLRHLLWF